MSMRSLLAAGVEMMARGTAARALAEKGSALTVAERLALGDRLYGRLTGLERGDRDHIQTLIDQQHRAVRAAERLETAGFVDARSVPVVESLRLQGQDNRYQVEVVISYKDPLTGQKWRAYATMGFNETIYGNELHRRIMDEADREALLRNESPPVPRGAALQVEGYEVLGIGRAF